MATQFDSSARRADPTARLAEAHQLLAAGRYAQADTLLQAALGSAALRPEAHYLLCGSALAQAQVESALQHAQAAVRLQSADARFQFALGRACKAANDLDGAVAAYRSALRLAPSYAEAHVSLGIALKAQGALDAAIACYEKALTFNPQLAAAHANLGNALALRVERAVEHGSDAYSAVTTGAVVASAVTTSTVTTDSPHDEVLAAQTRAIALDTGNPVLHRNHGVLLARAGQHWAAAHAFNQALTLDGADVEACLRLGACLRALGRGKTAQEAYEKWLAGNPPNAPVMRALAGVLTRDGQVDAALHWAQQAAAIDPDPLALMQIGNTLMQARRLDEAMAYCWRAVESPGAGAGLHPTLLIGTTYVHTDPHIIRDAHAEFGRRLPLPTAPRPPWHALAAGQRLRVGYVSGDFVRHSVAYFMAPLLEHHNQSDFDITCYHNLAWSDAVTALFKTYGHRWVECESLSNEQLRRRIVADGIDVLIDLAGHTSNSRVMMFALGAAPVQISYLGYPTATGVPAMDFRISDAVIDPGDVPPLPSEHPLCVPRTMFCYRPDADSPPLAPPPALQSGRITFGSFNNIAKITDHTLDAWAQALNAVPGSRLLLKSAAMAQASNRATMESFMAQRGIAAERLTLHARIDSKGGHLGLYNQVDIALDTSPYNGATTTCEALWMGVPVVTLSGRTHTSRMGASILQSIGKPEWVTHTDADYLATLVRMAGDIDALAAWRLQSRTALAQTALFDEVGFTRHFEQVLRQAWQRKGEAAAAAVAEM